jgi:hypothetical protein
MERDNESIWSWAIVLSTTAIALAAAVYAIRVL